MSSPPTVVQHLPELLTHATRARLFVEIRSTPGLTATLLARRLRLSVQNVHYHLKQLERHGVVTPSATQQKFVEKSYQLSAEVQRNLDLREFNTFMLDASPQARRSLVSAMCAVSAAQLLALAHEYQRLDSDDFDDLFLIENQGLVASLPISMAAARAFSEDLGQLIGTHITALQGEAEATDAYFVLGVLPFPPTRNR